MSQPVGGTRVLIVDDDVCVRGVLQEFLGTDYECEAFGSAEEALSRLDAGDVQLVISDISMEGMSGLELIPLVHAKSPDAVIIMVSGSQTVESAVGAMRAGAFDYITKPFDLEHVDVAVRRALEHHRLLASKHGYETFLEGTIRQRTSELDDALGSLESAYRMTLKALIAALEARDSETHGHSERVVAFSLHLGREMNLDREQLRSLEFGSLLHDIGKIGVPDAILRKPAALTGAEWEAMRLHPLHGQQILGGIKFLEGAARVVAQHHERWDGTGYPLGLRGEGIDLNARIFAVADAFDAITSNRVYRRGRSYDEAVEELDSFSGRQFDPAVVEAFRRIERGEWDALRRRPSSAGDGNSAPSRSERRARAASVRVDDGGRGGRARKFQRAGAH